MRKRIRPSHTDRTALSLKVILVSEPEVYFPSEKLHTKAYYLRLEKSLAIKFPRLRKTLGNKKFFDLSLHFAEKYPSEAEAFVDFGRQLPRFLRTSSHYREPAFLAELSRFEWAQLCAHSAQSESPTTLRDLHLAPSAHLITSFYNLKSPTKFKRRGRRPFYFAIYRGGDKIITDNLSENEWRILNWISQGTDFEVLARKAARFKISQKILFKYFLKLTQKGLVISALDRLL